MSRLVAAAVAATSLAVFTPAAPAAAQPSELFLSEYVEGTSNNKALELANPTDATIDLGAAGYEVRMYFNGNNSPGLTIRLTGTLAPADVFVLAHASAAPEIQAEADQINGAGWFNGDDAVVLVRGSTVVDSVGQVGVDPGAQWGTGDTSTADNTLRRKAGAGPDTDPSGPFDPASEWDGYPTNTFNGLGVPGNGTAEEEREPETAPCDAPVTHEIGAVQGAGAATPVKGQTVTIEAVVVGDFQGPGQLGGVFLQDPDGDGDALTSDGIFAFDPDARAVAPGDVVRVSGTVIEFHGLTELTDVTTMADCGDADVPAPTVLDLPAGDAVRERLEGMLVAFPEPLTATETYTLARYGELVVSAEGRLFQPTNDGGDDAAEQAGNHQRRLIVDDGSTVQNPDSVPFTDVDGGVIRLGDTVTGVTGVLSYGFGAWRLQPTEKPTVTATNPRPPAPDVVGDVTIASFNVLNYFTTIDAPGVVTDGGHDPRGADSTAELERQRAKLVAAINALDADVVGLMEIENDTDDAALDDLVAALDAAAGEPRYAAVEEPDSGGLFGTDAIKVAMLYRPAAVVPMGAAVTSTDPAFDNARLPLVQRFRPADGGKPFVVAVNHFKSKGCAGATGANLDQGDGQGCYNADRVEQAQALMTLLGAVPGDDVAVIGDLNAYGEEDPVDVLEAAGYVDLIDTRLTEADQYSYVFRGQAGYLDHALATPSLARRVSGVDIWHVNADEAPFLDYNTEFRPEGFYAPNPYRSSDHDPVVLGLAATPAATGRSRR
jgi:predicted extracellular nuclease